MNAKRDRWRKQVERQVRPHHRPGRKFVDDRDADRLPYQCRGDKERPHGNDFVYPYIGSLEFAAQQHADRPAAGEANVVNIVELGEIDTAGFSLENLATVNQRQLAFADLDGLQAGVGGGLEADRNVGVVFVEAAQHVRVVQGLDVERHAGIVRPEFGNGRWALHSGRAQEALPA